MWRLCCRLALVLSLLCSAQAAFGALGALEVVAPESLGLGVPVTVEVTGAASGFGVRLLLRTPPGVALRLEGTTEAVADKDGRVTFAGVRIVGAIDKRAQAALVAECWAANGSLLTSWPRLVEVKVAPAGEPAMLRFMSQPRSALPGAALPPVVVAVLDAQGKPVPGRLTLQVDLTGGPGPASLGGRCTEPTVAGLATFGDLTVDRLGQGYLLRATVVERTTLGAAVSEPFGIVTAGSAGGPATRLADFATLSCFSGAVLAQSGGAPLARLTGAVTQLLRVPNEVRVGVTWDSAGLSEYLAGKAASRDTGLTPTIELLGEQLDKLRAVQDLFVKDQAAYQKAVLAVAALKGSGLVQPGAGGGAVCRLEGPNCVASGEAATYQVVGMNPGAVKCTWTVSVSGGAPTQLRGDNPLHWTPPSPGQYQVEARVTIGSLTAKRSLTVKVVPKGTAVVGLAGLPDGDSRWPWLTAPAKQGDPQGQVTGLTSANKTLKMRASGAQAVDDMKAVVDGVVRDGARADGTQVALDGDAWAAIAVRPATPHRLALQVGDDAGTRTPGMLVIDQTEAVTAEQELTKMDSGYRQKWAVAWADLRAALGKDAWLAGQSTDLLEALNEGQYTALARRLADRLNALRDELRRRADGTLVQMSMSAVVTDARGRAHQVPVSGYGEGLRPQNRSTSIITEDTRRSLQMAQGLRDTWLAALGTADTVKSDAGAALQPLLDSVATLFRDDPVATLRKLATTLATDWPEVAGQATALADELSRLKQLTTLPQLVGGSDADRLLNLADDLYGRFREASSLLSRLPERVERLVTSLAKGPGSGGLSATAKALITALGAERLVASLRGLAEVFGAQAAITEGLVRLTPRAISSSSDLSGLLDLSELDAEWFTPAGRLSVEAQVLGATAQPVETARWDFRVERKRPYGRATGFLQMTDYLGRNDPKPLEPTVGLSYQWEGLLGPLGVGPNVSILHGGGAGGSQIGVGGAVSWRNIVSAGGGINLGTNCGYWFFGVNAYELGQSLMRR